MKHVLFSLGLVGSLVIFAACSDDANVHDGPQGGSGGSPNTADGGSSSGGRAPGTGGTGSGGEACDPSFGPAAGGAVAFDECAAWLGEPGWSEDFPNHGILNMDCSGQGGMGGDGSDTPTTPPALRSFCEAPSRPDLHGAHEIAECLGRIADEPCAPESADVIKACVTQPIPCFVTPSPTCEQLTQECSTLTQGECFWAMQAAKKPAQLVECFDEPRSDEPCDERFLRCAWGL